MNTVDKLIIQFDALQEQFNVLAILVGVNFVCILLLAFGLTYWLENRVDKMSRHYDYMKSIMDELEKKYGVLKDKENKERARARIGKM